MFDTLPARLQNMDGVSPNNTQVILDVFGKYKYQGIKKLATTRYLSYSWVLWVDSEGVAVQPFSMNELFDKQMESRYSPGNHFFSTIASVLGQCSFTLEKADHRSYRTNYLEVALGTRKRQWCRSAGRGNTRSVFGLLRMEVLQRHRKVSMIPKCHAVANCVPVCNGSSSVQSSKTCSTGSNELTGIVSGTSSWTVPRSSRSCYTTSTLPHANLKQALRVCSPNIGSSRLKENSSDSASVSASYSLSHNLQRVAHQNVFRYLCITMTLVRPG